MNFSTYYYSLVFRVCLLPRPGTRYVNCAFIAAGASKGQGQGRALGSALTPVIKKDPTVAEMRYDRGVPPCTTYFNSSRDTTGNSQRVPATSSRGRHGGGLRPTPRSRSRHLPQQLLAIQRQAQRRAQIGRGRAEVRGGGGGAHPRSAAIEGEVARSEAEGDVHLGYGPRVRVGARAGVGVRVRARVGAAVR